MSIVSEEYSGTSIITSINSSNIDNCVYDTRDSKLSVKFKNGVIYEYYNVPHHIFTKFRFSESQGKYLSTVIAKTYNYKKLVIEDNGENNTKL